MNIPKHTIFFDDVGGSRQVYFPEDVDPILSIFEDLRNAQDDILTARARHEAEDSEASLKALFDAVEKKKVIARTMLTMDIRGYNPFISFLKNQEEWSRKTFGEERRTIGVTEHIKRECDEIRANPTDLEEWVDVVLLALDGAWRAGYTAEQTWEEMQRKQQVNFARKWERQPEDQPTEHARQSGSDIILYPAMNTQIVGLLRLCRDPISDYAATRIEQLEKERDGDHK